MLPHCESYLSTRALNLISDLGSCSGRADNQHAARVEPGRAAVLSRGKHGDSRRHRASKRGHLQDVARSICEHNSVAVPSGLTRVNFIAVVPTASRNDGRVRLHRCGNELCISFDELDRLRHSTESVRVIALVFVAGKSALPIGGKQAQRIPTLGLPRVCDLATLEHHMIDRAFRKAPAHG